MSTDYREERRRDRSAVRAEDREDRRLEREERRRDQALAEERARRERRESQKRRERRKAARRESRSAALARLSREGDTVAALIVMACSIIPAVYYQIAALAAVPKVPVVIAVALAVMLEAGAWVSTVAGERAKAAGRPVGRFRAAMWACAAVAASINYSHAPGPDWFAWVLAASSFGGVAFWELRGAGRHGGWGGRSRAERRADRARAKQARRRKRRFADVWERHLDILAAHPYDSLDAETAWAQAWRDVHGAAVAVTAPVVEQRLAADAELEDVLDAADRTPERAAVELLLDDLFGADRGDDGPSGGTSGSAPSGPSGTGSGGARLKIVEPATPLGRKGKQPSGERAGRTAPKAPAKPLADADLEKVRALADTLGGAAHLSLKTVRQAVGGGANEYLVRLRNAVREERR
ncbi:hypothetical protein [Streptomyces daliensis]